MGCYKLVCTGIWDGPLKSSSLLLKSNFFALERYGRARSWLWSSSSPQLQEFGTIWKARQQLGAEQTLLAGDAPRLANPQYHCPPPVFPWGITGHGGKEALTG